MTTGRRRAEEGFAMIIAMMGLMLIGALGTALVLATSIETMIARNFRDGAGALYAAEAMAGYAADELSGTADWSAVLDGTVRSTFFDGPAGVRRLDDGTSIDLTDILTLANCGALSDCTDAQMAATVAARPFGLNNPRWQLYACGRLADLLGVSSRFYVVLLVADDPSETDANPLADGSGDGNPGSGVLTLRAEAFGPFGAREAVEMTIARGPGGPGPLRIVSWRATT